MNDPADREYFAWFERELVLGEPPPDATAEGGSPAESPAVASESLDVAVLRSLMLLTAGRPAEFLEHDAPAGDIERWLRHATRRELHGLLISALSRWHRLRGNGAGRLRESGS